MNFIARKFFPKMDRIKEITIFTCVFIPSFVLANFVGLCINEGLQHGAVLMESTSSRCRSGCTEKVESLSSTTPVEQTHRKD